MIQLLIIIPMLFHHLNYFLDHRNTWTVPCSPSGYFKNHTKVLLREWASNFLSVFLYYFKKFTRIDQMKQNYKYSDPKGMLEHYWQNQSQSRTNGDLHAIFHG